MVTGWDFSVSTYLMDFFLSFIEKFPRVVWSSIIYLYKVTLLLFLFSVLILYIVSQILLLIFLVRTSTFYIICLLFTLSFVVVVLTSSSFFLNTWLSINFDMSVPLFSLFLLYLISFEYPNYPVVFFFVYNLSNLEFSFTSFCFPIFRINFFLVFWKIWTSFFLYRSTSFKLPVVC